MLLTLALYTLSPVGRTQKAGQPADRSGKLTNAQREALIAKAKTLSVSMRKIGKLLRDANVSIDPSILFAREWRKRLDAYGTLVPDLHRSRQLGNRFKGVQIADTLVLPENVEISGDTLIVANQLVFAGKHVVIKGNHDLHLFQSEPILSVNRDAPEVRNSGLAAILKPGLSIARSVEFAKERELLMAPETVDISVGGYGREEWMEDQKKKEEKDKSKRNHANSPIQSANGAPGQKGKNGGEGSNCDSPQGQGQTGTGGNCAADKNGGTGGNGTDGGYAGTGHTGGPGSDGDPGNTLNVVIQGGGTYTLSAKGGQGGEGGDGGDGGFAGAGGQGGQGGPGAACVCPQPSGNGGSGGVGGAGCDGGNGGNGGPGGNGGNGGVINIFKPCDFAGTYSTNVHPGTRGPGGNPGRYSAGGAGGQGGSGGSAGSNVFCTLLAGNPGSVGPQGQQGSPGVTDGEAGAYGDPGESEGGVNVTETGSCGGGGDYGGLEAGGYTEYCTEWYFVFYHCEFLIDDEETASVTSRKATDAKANHAFRNYPALRSGWSCQEVGRTYVGCW